MNLHKIFSIIITALITVSCTQNENWTDYNSGRVIFKNLSENSLGSERFMNCFPDPEKTITELSYEVLKNLYFSKKDSIPYIKKINFTLKDYKGISAKSGKSPEVSIYYSTQWVEKCDTARVCYESKGILIHELTHVYQLEPKGIGNYGNNKTFRAFIEGVADAVRIKTGYMNSNMRPNGGHYTDGYKYTAFFFVWLSDNYDKEFIKKINESTKHVIPWSFDGAIKYSLGKEYSVKELWYEYSKEMGNVNN